MDIQTLMKPIDILLVEDRLADTRFFRETLVDTDAYHFELTCAENIGEASEHLSGKEFDVVLLDISMSDHTGFETFVNLRMLAPRVPIILLSSVHDEDLAIKALQNGAQDYLIKGQFSSSVLGRSIRYAIERHRIMSDLERARKREYRLAYFDYLTNLPNRQLFYDRLNQFITHAQRYKQKVALMFIDLDGFKNVNDTMGHGTGDLMLKAVAGRLKDCLRKSDTVARMGGDEFTCILPKIKGEDDISIVAKKINNALARPFELKGHNIYISCSIGISIFPDNSSEMHGLIKEADIAMYHAKRQGKNNFRFYSKSMTFISHEHMVPHNNMLRTIDHRKVMFDFR